MDNVTPQWLRERGDWCASRAGSYVGGASSYADADDEGSERCARVACEWFAAAAQAYQAANELSCMTSRDGQ